MTITKDHGAPALPELLTINEVADLFRCSRSTVYEWLKEGRLKALRIGGRTFVPRQVVDDLIAAALEG